MAGNSFGNIFKITTFGESHGEAIGVVIDGCPAGLKITASEIQIELDRRKPGQSKITTNRKENDKVNILSGIFEGETLGTPISLLIKNEDHNSKDYSHIKNVYRPSHADYTYQKKYGTRDYRGGGRSSARETAVRVAAGAIAKKILLYYNVSITAYVSCVKNIELSEHYSKLDFSLIENNIIRCPDKKIAEKMIELIDQTKLNGDTVGGTISCVVTGLVAGVGEPVFNKLHAEIGKAMLSINAVKGFEFGAGFEGCKLFGSEHNDVFETVDNQIKTKTNNSGGIQGGISNGMDIYFKVAFKPVATIMQKQNTININNENVTLKGKGRHDPCVLPRAVPIVEAMTALVLVDYILLNKLSKL